MGSRSISHRIVSAGIDTKWQAHELLGFEYARQHVTCTGAPPDPFPALHSTRQPWVQRNPGEWEPIDNGLHRTTYHVIDSAAVRLGIAKPGSSKNDRSTYLQPQDELPTEFVSVRLLPEMLNLLAIDLRRVAYEHVRPNEPDDFIFDDLRKAAKAALLYAGDYRSGGEWPGWPGLVYVDELRQTEGFTTE